MSRAAPQKPITDLTSSLPQSNERTIHHVFNIKNAPTGLAYLERFSKVIQQTSEMEINHQLVVLHNTKALSGGDSLATARNLNCYARILVATSYSEVASYLARANGQIILHELTSNVMVLCLMALPHILPRCSWVMWGGDLHYYLDKKWNFINLRPKLADLFFRRAVIRRFNFLIGLRSDFYLAKKHYNLSDNFLSAYYGLETIDEVLPKKKFEGKYAHTVMVGHSGSQFNNHIELFDLIKRKLPKSTRVICPLTYGSPEYISKVMEAGISYFGEAFQPICTHLALDDFASIMKSVDVAFFKSRRQQAVGTVALAVMAECKVFMKKEAAPYDWYRENNIKLFDIDDVDRLTPGEIFEKSDKSKISRVNVEALYSAEVVLRNWIKAFEELTKQGKAHGF